MIFIYRRVLITQWYRSQTPGIGLYSIKSVHCRNSSSSNRAVKRSDGGGNKEEERTWRWYSIPWGLGILCLAALQLIRTLRREREKGIESDPVTWQLGMFRLLPARPLSRAWGELASYELPTWLRKPVLGLYVWAFGCKMEEAVLEDLGSYRSLVELFTRRLKYGTRDISLEHELLSPSDGKVLHFGKVDSDGKLEQVKGVTYQLEYFLGSQLLNTQRALSLKEGIEKSSDKDCRGKESSIEEKLESDGHARHLYHVVLYLAPGDYHHFHSPVNWSIHVRRHFPGELLTVAPWAARTMPGLFALNERVVLSGQWKYGFFSFTAVGAYNVGSINIVMDKDLKTNVKGKYKMGEFSHRQLGGDEISSCLKMKRGDRLGHFNLGSSIVLIFEAPDHFKFQVKPGQTIKYGQPLGTFSSEQSNNNTLS